MTDLDYGFSHSNQQMNDLDYDRKQQMKDLDYDSNQQMTDFDYQFSDLTIDRSGVIAIMASRLQFICDENQKEINTWLIQNGQQLIPNRYVTVFVSLHIFTMYTWLFVTKNF